MYESVFIQLLGGQLLTSGNSTQITHRKDSARHVHPDGQLDTVKLNTVSNIRTIVS